MAPLVVESWVWWSVVILVAASRFISRWMARGWHFQADDYGMIVALGFYTTFIVTINIVSRTSSNLFPAGFDIDALTESERQDRIFGSKLILVLEQCQIVTIWIAKICLLTLYLRLTTLRWQNFAIKAIIGYVVVAFIVMEILYLGVWCRPFSQYWAIPPNSSQCNAATNHLITNASFNLTSDVFMLAIALPIFVRMKLPMRRKIPLVGIFSLGLFVILAAILNKVYSFSQPFGAMWTYWYVRESSTALLVANLPFVWKFWRKAAGFKPSVTGSANPTRADTAISIGAEDKHKDSAAQQPAFMTDWPSNHKEDVELEGEFRRAGRGMTLEEFLRDGPASGQRDAEDASGGPSGQQRAVLQDTTSRDRVRRDSDPETHGSTPASSTLPLSASGSWSARSFV